MADRRRWGILAIGTFAQAATCSFLYGMPMLVPALQQHDGLSLYQASLLVSAPIVGLLLTLIAWGALADRFGERVVMVTGVGGAAVVLAFVPLVHGTGPLAALLALAGACAASVNAASGRMVMGWFPAAERGLAMGTRQTAQPLGVALAALVLPGLGAHFGPRPALLFPAALCLLAASLVFALASDPLRPPRRAGQTTPASPYRGSRTLLRIHAASTMLVVPQFAVATFTLTYLHTERHWNAAVAGRWIFAFQAAGALGRICSGVWSDRVRSRLRPMRQLGVLSAALMLLLSLGALTHQWWIVVVFAVSAIVTVADNGLAYTSVAEVAGPAWSGRALGAHNTMQNIASVLAAPMLAAVIGGSHDAHYADAFLLAALFPMLAVPLTPVRAERQAAERQAADGQGVEGADGLADGAESGLGARWSSPGGAASR